ncbi:MAG: helix-turn-helix domain-containing protein [Campylobacterota bacterium]|nr:helix-turn-helix domain-containing protein [Campylobacterota bacterium]
MTFLEKRLMELFCLNQNKMLSYFQIIEYIWDYDDEDKFNSLKTLIKTLRKKLPKDSIENIFKEGYIFKN